MKKTNFDRSSPRQAAHKAFSQNRLAAAVIATLAIAPELSVAANCTWLPATGNWGSAGNWSCGVVPSGPAADTANVASGQTSTIDTAQSIRILNNAGSVNIDAFLLTLQTGGSTTNSGTIKVGGPTTAALQMFHGIDNTGGTINVGSGSFLNQFGGTITGGTIETTGSGALVAFSSGSNVLSGVTLNGTLDLATTANSRERIANGLTLNGAVNVANGGILSLDSSLTTGGNQTIAGTGTINLNDAAARLAVDGAGTTTLGSGITVRGQGNIGQAAFAGGNNTLVNNGVISADVDGGTLNIVNPANGGASSLSNNGTLRATNGGKLQLSTNVNASGNSQIVADAGSQVIQNGVRISGTVNTSGSGLFSAVSSGSNFLDGATLNGTLDLASIANARERIVNGLTLNGSINVGDSGILSLDRSASAADQTIGGTGTINLNGPGARLAVEGAGTTTLGANITVRGQGNIGQAAFAGGNHTLVNNGLIAADVNGGTLNIVNPANGGGSSLTNNGTLRATNGGKLQLSTDVTANTGSEIVADTGSQVVQNGVRITGEVNTSGSGQFSASSSGSNVLSGVAFTGTLDLTSITNSRERIANGLTLNGAVNVGNGGILSLDSSLTAGGNQTIAGNGTINLNDAAARLAVDGAGTTTLGSGITVRGQGNIGQAIFAGGNNTLVNNGVISADVDGGTLNIVNPANGGASSLTNNGTLRATNGGKLQLSTDVNASGNSQIVADAGSQVVQNGVRISGTVNTSGSGLFSAVSSANNFLDGATLNGTLDLASIANARERIVNGLTLNGSIDVGNSGILSLDRSASAADQTVGGTGTINLNAPGARLAVEGTGTTTLGANITVRGQGNIGQAAFAGGNHTLVNNGLISADVGGGTLNIVNPANGGSSLLTNNGTLRATNGGTLQLSTNVTANTGSEIVADTGSQVVQNGVRITGEVNTSGSGRFSASSSGSNVLSGAAFTGTLDLTSITNSRERIANGLTLNGAVNVANGGILSLDSSLTAGGNQTIAGNGTINLNDAAARLAVDGAGTTTLDSGITVRGQGNIGQAIFAGGNNTLVNNGRISADVSGATLNVVNPANGGASSVTNNGVMEAVNGATLAVFTAMTNASDGTLTAGAGSLVNLQTSGFVNQGLIQGDGSLQTLNAATALVNDGKVAPGVNGIGTLTLNGRYTQTATGALDIGLNSLTSFDLFKVNGTANLNGTLDLFCSGACSMAVGDEITILDATVLTGTFTNLALFGFGSGAFDVLYDTANGDVKLRVTEAVAAVPLPAAAWLLMSGLAGMGAIGRRRKA